MKGRDDNGVKTGRYRDFFCKFSALILFKSTDYNFFFSVVPLTFNTGLETITPAAIFPDLTAVVNGEEHGKEVLKHFSLQTGEEISTVVLHSDLHDLVQIQLAGTTCLALAFAYVSSHTVITGISIPSGKSIPKYQFAWSYE